jgi:hypothetical protein
MCEFTAGKVLSAVNWGGRPSAVSHDEGYLAGEIKHFRQSTCLFPFAVKLA